MRRKKSKTTLKMKALIKSLICTVGVRYAATLKEGIGNVYTYRAPKGKLYLGCEVVVPAGPLNRRALAYVVEVHDTRQDTDPAITYKDVLGITVPL